jgi:two-component system response regulator TctD
MRVLLIEDRREPDGLTRALSVVGLKVEPCPDVVVADGMLRDHAFDVAIFDLVGPESDGLEVLRGLRRRGDATPVLVLTAGSNANERVIGLNAGADDCMSKPFELSELEARVRAIGRRAVHAMPTQRVGMLEFDGAAKRFTAGNRLLNLPRREHDLLEVLIEKPRRPVSKLVLAARLCSTDQALSHDALEVYVHRLRRRLAGTGASIHTHRGVGYSLEEENHEAAWSSTSISRRDAGRTMAPSG